MLLPSLATQSTFSVGIWRLTLFFLCMLGPALSAAVISSTSSSESLRYLLCCWSPSVCFAISSSLGDDALPLMFATLCAVCSASWLTATGWSLFCTSCATSTLPSAGSMTPSLSQTCASAPLMALLSALSFTSSSCDWPTELSMCWMRCARAACVAPSWFPLVSGADAAASECTALSLLSMDSTRELSLCSSSSIRLSVALLCSSSDRTIADGAPPGPRCLMVRSSQTLRARAQAV
mmetsp:Transcript_95596/g.247180  ORF Transcript_95596/g.247180 Transcript_95596/m.247180 type:complete len:236 (+) Transcript_95596:348-1055(+)